VANGTLAEFCGGGAVGRLHACAGPFDDSAWLPNSSAPKSAERIGYTPAPAFEFRIGVLRLDRGDVVFLFRFPLGFSSFAFEFQVAVAVIIAMGLATPGYT